MDVGKRFSRIQQFSSWQQTQVRRFCRMFSTICRGRKECSVGDIQHYIRLDRETRPGVFAESRNSAFCWVVLAGWYHPIVWKVWRSRKHRHPSQDCHGSESSERCNKRHLERRYTAKERCLCTHHPCSRGWDSSTWRDTCSGNWTRTLLNWNA